MKVRLREQAIPLFLTLITFLFLWVILYIVLRILNLITHEDIILQLRKRDILVGLTIYLKTSVDFGIFIGNLMKNNPGWKKRIAIELGTALGNALGTLVVLFIWNFFRSVPLLMGIMIVLASLVLLKMAQESLYEFSLVKNGFFSFSQPFFSVITSILSYINTFFNPLLRKIVPHVGFTTITSLSWKNLLFFSFTIPFILGLDDFAGYIPLFSIINVYGFALGVFLGHMILNVSLFVSPSRTVKIVSNPFILLLGGTAFIGIALWGFYEAIRLFIEVF